VNDPHDMTLAEVHELARERGIPGYPFKSKNALLRLLGLSNDPPTAEDEQIEKLGRDNDANNEVR